jgi:hypothetical protein
MRDGRAVRVARGQTMVELALVLPLFLSVLMGIVILGIGVFYQQQVTNAAREAARYAAVNSATSRCPTVSRLDPGPPGVVDPVSGRVAADTGKPLSYLRCDRPEDGWPNMTAQARSLIFGFDRNALGIAACWSGYVTNAPGQGSYDAAPPNTDPNVTSQVWAQCSIGGHDPTIDPSQIACDSALVGSTVDTASDASERTGITVGNRVTGLACYVWTPPLAGFLLIPQQVTLRGVITEAIQRQQ